jgi:taurine dioxygenase
MSPTLTPLSNSLGVEVTGIDLSEAVDHRVAAELEKALVNHLVMVVRDQQLTPPQLMKAVGLLGEIMPQHLKSLRMPDHPEIVVLDSRNTKKGADGKFVPIGARDWHTDHAHQERPPNYTALYAVKLPSSGGDTSFANMQAAFESLPSSQQDDLLRLNVITKIDDRYSTAEDQQKNRDARKHPLVRTHPVTGLKAIFFHPGMVERLDGMEPNASLTYLDQLIEQTVLPEVTYRHTWRPGDLVIMDNRSQMHVAHADYDFSEGRTLHRVLVKGDVPY